MDLGRLRAFLSSPSSLRGPQPGPPQSPTLCRQTRAAFFRSLAISPLCWVEAAARLGSRVWRWGPR